MATNDARSSQVHPGGPQERDPTAEDPTQFDASSPEAYRILSNILSSIDEFTARLESLDCDGIRDDVTKRREVAQRVLAAALEFLALLPPLKNGKPIVDTIAELTIGIDELHRGHLVELLNPTNHGASSPIKKAMAGDPAEPKDLINRAAAVAAINFLRRTRSVGYRKAAIELEQMAWSGKQAQAKQRQQRVQTLCGFWEKFPKQKLGERSDLHQIRDESGLERVLPLVREAFSHSRSRRRRRSDAR